ncbi:fibronectin type III domain protein [Ostertagia ostertagi]
MDQRSNATREDYGQYRVVVENSVGQDSTTVGVTVADCPEPPRFPIVENVLDEAVILSWKPPNLDGGSIVTQYIVEKRDTSGGAWEPCAKTRFACLTVEGCRPKKTYEFRVSAENKHGVSQPCEPTTPVLIPGDDRIRPRNYDVDDSGKVIRGKGPTMANYDGYVIDVWKQYYPQEVEIKHSPVLDYYDIHEEIGTGAFGVLLPLSRKMYRTRYCRMGEMVRLKIYFSGTPPFNHSLTLNKEEVVADHPTIRTVDFDDHILITIPSLSTREAGRYEYTISNDSGVASTGFWLNVTGLPGAPQGPLHFSNVGTHQVSLSWRPPVNDGGSKITNYVIEKRDVAKEDWTVVASSVRDLSFTVQGLFENHEYEFRVSAANENGQGVPLVGENAVVTRLPYDRPGAPTDLEVAEVGDDCLTLTWHRPLSDGGGRIRGYYIEKCEDDKEQTWVRCNQNPSPANTFNVQSLIDGRKYKFRVFAVNDAGLSDPAEMDLEFKSASGGTPPEIISQLSDQSVEPGRSATFECKITGSPRPEYSWFKGMKELVDTSRFTILSKGDVQILMVNHANPDDADEYTCRATNKFGTKSTRAQLLFMSKPRVFLPPRYHGGYEAQKSETIELKIPYKAFPRAESRWTKEGEKIESGGRYEITTDDKFATLRISNATREDYGQYRVVVENSVGQDSTTVGVTVADCPEPPRFPIVENVLDEAVILSWKPPNLDGGSIVTQYIVEKRDTSGGAWEPCAKTRFACLTVEGCRPKKTYEFRVSAENKHGVSQPCEPTTPVLIPG